MKTILFFLVMSACCIGQQTDYIRTKDYNLHVYSGMAVASTGAAVNDATGLNAPNWAAHLGTAVAVGTLKEIWDASVEGERFSVEDWGATLMGGTISWAADELFKWIGIDTRYTRAAIIIGGIVGVGLTVNLK